MGSTEVAVLLLVAWQRTSLAGCKTEFHIERSSTVMEGSWNALASAVSQLLGLFARRAAKVAPELPEQLSSRLPSQLKRTKNGTIWTAPAHYAAKKRAKQQRDVA